MSKIRRELEALREENARLRQLDLEGCDRKVGEENADLRIEITSLGITVSNLRKRVELYEDEAKEAAEREVALGLRIEELEDDGPDHDEITDLLLECKEPDLESGD